MLLEEERKGEKSKSESISYKLSVSTKDKIRPSEIKSKKYKICKKNHRDIY